MPIESLPTIDVSPRKSHSKSWMYFISFLFAIYTVSDIEKMGELLVCFLSWLDDLFIGNVEILM
jgi:hypothetical protein